MKTIIDQKRKRRWERTNSDDIEQLAKAFDISSEQNRIIERLAKTFDVSSEKNRNIMFFFLGVQLYLLVAVGGTTDVNLLLPNSNFILPIVNIALPLNFFYFIAPPLFLLLHLNVLLNLSRHMPILLTWRQQAKSSALQFPYLINLLDDTKGKPEMLLVNMLCNVVYVSGPLILLVFFQVRYSDYHSVWASTYHFCLVLADLVILYIYT